MKYKVTIAYNNVMAKFNEKSKAIFTVTVIGETGLKRIMQKYADIRYGKNYTIKEIIKVS